MNIINCLKNFKTQLKLWIQVEIISLQDQAILSN